MPMFEGSHWARSGKLVVAAMLLACACTTEATKKGAEASPEPTPAEEEADAAVAPTGSGKVSDPQTAPPRVVAIGDLHGDLDATRRAFRLAGATNVGDEWIGGDLVVVQTGDTVDRGDDDRAIIDFIEHLKTEAPKSGGKLVAMVGNHEVMNTLLDFRYVTEGAMTAFDDVEPATDAITSEIAKLKADERGRAAAFLPGGPYAKILATRPVVARVGDTIFLHGGLLPKFVEGIDDTNQSLHDWLLGDRPKIPAALTDDEGPLWARDYSDKPGTKECAALEETLSLLGAKRMVMGHTVQDKGINAACDDKAWRIDVGMSSYYNGPIQVLELRGDALAVLKE